jgi:hypothetical protein
MMTHIDLNTVQFAIILYLTSIKMIVMILMYAFRKSSVDSTTLKELVLILGEFRTRAWYQFLVVICAINFCVNLHAAAIVEVTIVLTAL